MILTRRRGDGVLMDIRCQRRSESHNNVLELGQYTIGSAGAGDGRHVLLGQQLLGLVGKEAGVRRVVVDVPAEGCRRD